MTERATFEPHGAEAIAAHDVSLIAADGALLLRPVSLTLGQEKTGLIGRNGAGKTTLARILAGDLTPTAGHVTRRGRVGYLPQRIDPAEGDEVADLLGIAPILAALRRIEGGSVRPEDFDRVGERWDVAEQAAAHLDALGLGHLPLDRDARTLSGGERIRVALAGCLLAAPELLILDEPTNNLDAGARRRLREALGRWPGGLLVVSHDRELLGGMDRIAELGHEGLTLFGGGWALYEAQRAQRDAALAQDVVDAQKALAVRKRESQAAQERQAKREPRGRAKARREGVPRILMGAMKQRAELTTARLGSLHGERVEQASAALTAAKARLRPENEVKIDLSATRLPAQKRVVELRGLTFSHPGGPPLFGEGISLTVMGPERLALVGPNGCGKTTLARILAGLTPPGGGEVYVGVPEVGWLDQNARVLTPGQRVLDTFRALNPDLDEGTCRWRLARFLLGKDMPLRPPEALSGGERVRAAMACILGGMDPPQLLILDEPTNDLDLDTIEQVESALRAYEGALILISHDEAFLTRVGVGRRVPVGGRPGPPTHAN